MSLREKIAVWEAPLGRHTHTVCHETSLTSPIAQVTQLLTVSNHSWAGRRLWSSWFWRLFWKPLDGFWTQGGRVDLQWSAHLWSPSQITGSSWNDPAEEWVGKSYSSTLNSSLKNSLGSHMGMGKTSIFKPGIACSCPQIIYRFMGLDRQLAWWNSSPCAQNGSFPRPKRAAYCGLPQWLDTWAQLMKFGGHQGLNWSPQQSLTEVSWNGGTPKSSKIRP